MRAAILSLLTVVTVAGAAMAATSPRPRPEGAAATCRHQSSAAFPKSTRDLVVGPLVLIGARAYSPPNVISTFGGQKYPAVLLAGHRVTIELSRSARRSTSVLYADEHRKTPDGQRTVGDGHRVVEFTACPRHRSGSSYDGRKATFWSGLVLTAVPSCLKMRVWIDDERSPRRAHLPLGKRCA